MSITEKMVAVKNVLVEQERNASVAALMETLHHRIAPRIGDSESFPLFGNDEEFDTFCATFKLNPRALLWVLGEMKKEGLLSSDQMPVLLSPLGIGKLCKD